MQIFQEQKILVTYSKSFFSPTNFEKVCVTFCEKQSSKRTDLKYSINSQSGMTQTRAALH